MWAGQQQSYVAACTPEQCMGTAHLPAGVEQRPPLSLRLPGAAEVACRSLQSDAWPPSAVQQAPQPLLARCSGCRHLHAAQGCGCLALLRSQNQRLSLCFASLAASCTEAWQACGWRLQQRQSSCSAAHRAAPVMHQRSRQELQCCSHAVEAAGPRMHHLPWAVQHAPRSSCCVSRPYVKASL